MCLEIGLGILLINVVSVIKIFQEIVVKLKELSVRHTLTLLASIKVI